MTTKIAISISDRSYEYLKQVTNNRSAFIENLIAQHQQQQMMKQLEQAYIDQENDPEFQEEIVVWDSTIGDGISA